MTVSSASAVGSGASLTSGQMWEQANWPQIETGVKRLQMRIAKAVRESRWGKVKALQRLLTRAYSGKMIAVKRITENRGKRTPGIDGKVWQFPAAKWNGMLSLQHRGYQAMPLRRIYIPKSNGKKRPLGSHVCGIARCRLYGSLHWSLYQNPWRIRILMVFGPNVQLLMPSNNVSKHSVEPNQLSKSLKVIFGVALTISVTSGSSNMYRWTGLSCVNGLKQDISIRDLCSKHGQALRKAELSRPSSRTWY